MTQISSAHQSTRHSITLSRESNHKGPQTHPSITRGVPLLFAWTTFFQVYYGLEEVFGNIVLFQYFSYVAIVLIWLLAFYSVRSWIKTVDKRTKATVITLLLFLGAFPIGLFTAEYVPAFGIVRRTVVGNYSGASYLLILLVAPSYLHQLRSRVERVIVIASILGAVYLIYDFWRIQQFGVMADRQPGIFDQTSISSMWVILGVLVLLFRHDTIRLPRPVLLVLAAGLSVSELLAGGFLALIVAGIFWAAYVFDEIRHPALRVVLISFLLPVFGIYAIAMLANPSDGVASSQVLNHRVTAIINTIKTGDMDYLDSASTFALRWASTVRAIKEMPQHFLRGKGLDQRELWTTYEQSGRLRARWTIAHNAIVITWLQAGALAAVPYALFIWYLGRLLWFRFERMGRRAWGMASVLALILTVASVTGPFDTTLSPLLMTLLCFSNSSTTDEVV